MQTTDPFELDLSIPRHARAYLLAAGQFLSNWPQEWDAETLAMALVDEENPNQKLVDVWDSVKQFAADIDSDPHLTADSLIYGLAEGFITFAEDNKADLVAILSEIVGQEKPSSFGYDAASVAMNDDWRARARSILADHILK